ncbi:MAG: hypothetical protein NWS47_03375, partial [Alphaproteobacteria bacterium]|nr:hypothetical protein [Alphaproteobacteria bacterium]
YKIAVGKIKKEIKTIKRARGELLPILKKESSYSEIEDDAKPTTGKKLKGLGEDDVIQITEHAGYLIPEDEYGTETEAAAAANEELEMTYGISPEKFRRKKVREAGSGNTTGKNRDKNGAAGTKFKDGHAIISHLKSKSCKARYKVKDELELFYKYFGFKDVDLNIYMRLFIDDPEAKTMDEYLIGIHRIKSLQTEDELKCFDKELKEKHGQLVLADRLLIHETSASGDSFSLPLSIAALNRIEPVHIYP